MRYGYIIGIVWAMTAGPLRADLIDDLETPESQPKTTKPEPTPSKPTKSDKKGATSPVKKEEKSAPNSEGKTSPEGNKKPATGGPAPKKETTTGPAKKAGNEDRKRIPIHLASEGNSVYTPEGVLKIPKAVVVTQGDVKLESNAADVYFLKQKNQGQNEIDRVEMRGNVRVTKFSQVESERMNARSDKALFENSARKVTLIGNVRVIRQGSVMNGKQMTYDLDTNLITVDEAGGVVKPQDAASNNSN